MSPPFYPGFFWPSFGAALEVLGGGEVLHSEYGILICFRAGSRVMQRGRDAVAQTFEKMKKKF
jgi:hypothetical protein